MFDPCAVYLRNKGALNPRKREITVSLFIIILFMHFEDRKPEQAPNIWYLQIKVIILK